MASDPGALRRLSIIGAGRVGRTLVRLWHQAGLFSIGEVVATTAAHAADAAAFIGAGEPRAAGQPLAEADLYLLSVADDRIESVARALATDPAIGPGVIAFHCSGALDSGKLEPLKMRGARCASLHPMHSFADPHASLTSFAGSSCALEGDPAALEILHAACVAIGVRPVTIEASGKPLYHAAGVLASNYLVALLDSADDLLTTAGFEEADRLALLEPLVRGTVDNLFEHGAAHALSGPVVRGDAGVVERQLQTIERHTPQHAALYRGLGEAAMQLASRSNRLDADGAARIATALGLKPASGE